MTVNKRGGRGGEREREREREREGEGGEIGKQKS
jgi:hypothetical protein